MGTALQSRCRIWRLLLSVLPLIFLLPVAASAELDSLSLLNELYQDVVLLTTGGKVQGKILQSIEDDVVVIKRRDGHIFHLPWEKVALVTNEDDYWGPQKRILDSLSHAVIERLDPSGIVGIGSKGFGTGLHIVVGTTVSTAYYLGLGIGYEIRAEEEITYLPFFAEFHRYFGRSQVSPYLYAHAGYTVGWIDAAYAPGQCGLIGGIGLGVLYTFFDRSAFTLQLGLRFRNIEEKRSDLGLGQGEASAEVGIAF